MESKPPFTMTPFDQMVTSEFLQIIKLVIPYLPSDLQRMAGVFAKLTELQNAIYYFQPPYHHSRRGRLRQNEMNSEAFFQDLKPYLPPDMANMFENMSQAMSMMEMMQSMNMEDMMQSMNMEDFMGAFQQERSEQDERMDESSGNARTGSSETGTD